MKIYEYSRENCVDYAKKWALKRNEKYYDYERIGGDCTNFVSQCVYSGTNVMNYNFNNGWYYVNPNDKSPSWTGVEFFYKFLTSNNGLGPFGEVTEISDVLKGDVIQLGNQKKFFHSLIVCDIKNGVPLVCCHSADVLLKPLTYFNYERLRAITVKGFRKYN